MIINADFHSHSGYAGGVGNISLKEIETAMRLKGIHVFGTGDCLHPEWKIQLKKMLSEKEDGLFILKDSNGVTDEKKQERFVLQTEIIVTAKIGEKRKSVHTLVLFPSFESIDKTVNMLGSFGMRNTVGRPFLKCNDAHDVGTRLGKIMDLDDKIEIIPAHVMTPQGVYGSNNPITYMKDFYSSMSERISTVETGLSADPVILNLIPELDSISLISNSDTHSPALNRVGREFTSFDLDSISYGRIIDAMRKRKVARTAEFNPQEGRFFMTGHRAGKIGHNDAYCVFSHQNTPKDKKCPICRKSLTVGVLEQAMLLGIGQGEKRDLDSKPKAKRDFVHMVPLTEIIAYTLGIGNTQAPKVTDLYMKIVSSLGSEAELWFKNKHEIEKSLEGIVSQDIIENIIQVKNDNFGFYPVGFDGTYGKLVIGKKIDTSNVKIIYCKFSVNNKAASQRTLF